MNTTISLINYELKDLLLGSSGLKLLTGTEEYNKFKYLIRIDEINKLNQYNLPEEVVWLYRKLGRHGGSDFNSEVVNCLMEPKSIKDYLIEDYSSVVLKSLDEDTRNSYIDYISSKFRDLTVIYKLDTSTDILAWDGYHKGLSHISFSLGLGDMESLDSWLNELMRENLDVKTFTLDVVKDLMDMARNTKRDLGSVGLPLSYKRL